MQVLKLHRPLIVVAGLMIVIALAALIGIVADDRTLVGVPIWIKPFKFAVSIAIYATTIAWLLPLLERRRRAGWWLGAIIAATMLVEMMIIVGQAARGHQSHFNNQTPLDAALFGIMGATIAVAWVCTLLIAILLLIQRLPDRASALAVRMGIIVALGGMFVGFLMTLPTSAQLATGNPTIIGAHSVGVADGGPGLPLVNWSTTGGDLRAGHFIGMHALQALPLFAFALVLAGRRIERLRSDRVRTRLIGVFGLLYAGLTVLITWQALRGQPLIHPDGLTLGALAVLLVLTAVGAVWATVPVAPAAQKVAA
ncbi:hypothetical protein [Dactylosporangium matsuzakiense]|uniref:Uncharacterized protein n=1 Tax=Dactylosporangium matsuzakiense TaxID=53360 RepID=A0A9W6KUT5_9ACTN|nr:hypothetical protein [Dactylosporangium matsuzakiense]UWZ43426.1 hypothetical protein Dmats_39150 [Dactylosporangium matsuzakiense]GLL05859.1 hypothetical protein GCM10017581_076070 [Dactylosporangium matsuzakiense]